MHILQLGAGPGAIGGWLHTAGGRAGGCAAGRLAGCAACASGKHMCRYSNRPQEALEHCSRSLRFFVTGPTRERPHPCAAPCTPGTPRPGALPLMPPLI